jgi:O-antigen/teichoic acid export membrane protein
VVLNTLGAEDYGIYSVVGGVVAMLGFFSGAMTSASERYFAIEIGRGDYDQLKKIFSLNVEIYILFAIVIIILGETLGLWFVRNKMSLPPERKQASLYIYHLALLSFVFTMIVMPYKSIIVSYEDINIYAYISILESFLKLGIVFLIRFITWDKLKLYGILLCVATFVSSVMYWIVCFIKYKECKIQFYWDKKLVKEIVIYTGYNTLGVFSSVIKNQAVTILLNQFFNPIVSAARGIALSVNGAASSFSINFFSAINPQVFKSYAKEEKGRMFDLVFQGSKTAYLLMYVFSLPLLIELPIIMSIWLGTFPEFTVVFTRLTIIAFLIGTTTGLLASAIAATGKIKLFQIVNSCVELLNFPVSYFLLLGGFPVYSVMILSVVLACLTCLLHIFILRRVILFSIKFYFRKVLIPLCAVTILSAIFPLLFHIIMIEGIARFLVVTITSVVSICTFSYLIGLNSDEKEKIKLFIRGKMAKNL